MIQWWKKYRWGHKFKPQSNHYLPVRLWNSDSKSRNKSMVSRWWLLILINSQLPLPCSFLTLQFASTSFQLKGSLPLIDSCYLLNNINLTPYPIFSWKQMNGTVWAFDHSIMYATRWWASVVMLSQSLRRCRKRKFTLELSSFTLHAIWIF